MFISFVLIQVKRTKEKIKTSTGHTVFVDQFHLILYIPIFIFWTGLKTSPYEMTAL
ncbi:MAG: hypothetical protein J7K51_01150 [Thermotogae bacterium]|nr:hypothetical protein [Thermotogota bacterium]